jgi:hypothetical protein
MPIYRSVPRNGPAFAGAAILVLAAMTGCAPQPIRQLPPRPPAPAGVWYALPTPEVKPDIAGALRRDFANIARMGLDTVLVRDCPLDQVAAVRTAAQRHQLRLVFTDPVARDFVENGKRRPGWFAPPAVVPNDPSVAARYIGYARDRESLTRARQLSDVARRAQPPLPLVLEADATLAGQLPADAFDYVIWHLAPTEDAPGQDANGPGWGIARIDCQGPDSDAPGARAWLARYHSVLTAGVSDGFVLDAYRQASAEGGGIVGTGGPLSPERAALVRRIAERSRAWRDVLAGMAPRYVETQAAGGGEVRVALLADGSRYCLLIVNPSAKHFARGEITVTLAGDAADRKRAVTVASADHTVVGPVYRVRAGRVAIPVGLPPGEALLFELY